MCNNQTAFTINIVYGANFMPLNTQKHGRRCRPTSICNYALMVCKDVLFFGVFFTLIYLSRTNTQAPPTTKKQLNFAESCRTFFSEYWEGIFEIWNIYTTVPYIVRAYVLAYILLSYVDVHTAVGHLSDGMSPLQTANSSCIRLCKAVACFIQSCHSSVVCMRLGPVERSFALFICSVVGEERWFVFFIARSWITGSISGIDNNWNVWKY